MQSSIEFYIYYEDTDASGYVYHANYLKFCERGRTEVLRLCSVDHGQILDRYQAQFVIHRAEMTFHRPALLDDRILVVSKVTDTSGARIIFKQEVIRNDDILFAMTCSLALINTDGSPIRIPKDLVMAMSR